MNNDHRTGSFRHLTDEESRRFCALDIDTQTRVMRRQTDLINSGPWRPSDALRTAIREAEANGLPSWI